MERALATLSLGAAQFFRWWFGELAVFLPARWRSSLKHERRQLVVALAKDEVAFSYRHGGTLRDLGSIPFAPGSNGEVADRVKRLVRGSRLNVEEVVLHLAGGGVLRRQVELPLAAMENLREVLSFEMDRHTPFSAEEVYFDYRLISTDKAAKRLDIDLAVVPRAIADDAVGRLVDWALNPDRLESDDFGGRDGEKFNLLPSSNGRTGGGGSRRLTVILAVLACILFAVALYLPVRAKEEVLAEAEARLVAIKIEAAEASAIGEEVDEVLKRGRFVIGLKNSKPIFAELLNEVTELLPDDTWLIRFGWNNDRVTLSGYSGSSSQLIGLLEGSDLLKEVRFISPLTVDQRIGLERFNLSAQLEGRGES